MSAGTGRKAARGGFTLVEILVAMVLGAVIITALAPPLVFVAQQQRRLAGETRRDAALAAAANRFTAMPFDELDDHDAESTTVGEAPDRYEINVDVTETAPREREVVLVVTPIGPLEIPPDTAIINRSRSRAINPFNAGS